MKATLTKFIIAITTLMLLYFSCSFDLKPTKHAEPDIAAVSGSKAENWNCKKENYREKIAEKEILCV